MPFRETKYEDIIFSPEVQSFCISEKFRCPNYNHSWACPPHAPYMEDELKKYDKYFLIYAELNLHEYLDKLRKKYPRRSEKSIRNQIYYSNISRKRLKREIMKFLQDHKNRFKDILILWGGHCRVCEEKRYINCSIDEGEPCRFPNQIAYSMEAVGIDVTETVKNLGFSIEWPPINYYYRFGLICVKS